MCRAYLTLCAFSLAFGCMLGLMIANRMLDALEDGQERRRLDGPRLAPLQGWASVRDQEDDLADSGVFEYRHDRGMIGEN